jgi:serine/threonine protein kinase
MGEVYKAHDARLRRTCHQDTLVVADNAAWERFQREARAASALSHPNICTIHDVGEGGPPIW